MRFARGSLYVLPFLGSCLEPTEVKLLLSTDIPDLTNVIVRVDNRDVGAMLPRKHGDLGTLVFVPSKKAPRFAVVVEGTTPTQTVKASRSVAYLEHQTLELPIKLEASCLGHVCDPGYTCNNGDCVSDVVDCRIDKTCVTDAGPPGDVVTPPADSGPPPCPKPGSRISLGGEQYRWTFDDMDPMSTTDSDKQLKIALKTGFLRTPDPPCGQGLVLGGMQDLAFGIMPSVIAFSFELLVPSKAILPVTIFRGSGASQATWAISIEKNMTLGLGWGNVVQMYPTTSTIKPDTRNHVEVLLTPSAPYTINLAIENQMVEKITASNGLPPSLNMSASPADGIMIDELTIFDGIPGN